MNHRRRRIRSLCFRYNTGQSGRRESNPRSRAPKAREAPFLFLPVSVLRCSDPCGIRTQPLQLERLTTSPEVERAVLLCARTLSAVGREALESSSAAFQATAKPSQLPTHDSLLASPAITSTGQQKKPDVLATPGFGSQFDLKAKRHKRSGSAGELSVSGRFRCAQ